MNLDRLIELPRYTLIAKRDGQAEADAFARRTISIYLATVKNKRKKQGRNFNYRRELLEGAYSFRHILRSKQELGL